MFFGTGGEWGVCPAVSVLIAANIVINVECSVRPLGAVMGEDPNMLPIQFSQADILREVVEEESRESQYYYIWLIDRRP